MRKTWTRRAQSIVLTTGASLGALCLLWTLGIAALGIRPLVFLSGSMAPSINAGDVGFVRTVSADEVAVGDVISVISSTEERVTHRVAAASTEGEGITFRTKGDANNTIDAESYSLTSVDRVVWVIPALGHVLTFAATPLAMILGAILALACLWLGLVRPSRDQQAELSAVSTDAPEDPSPAGATTRPAREATLGRRLSRAGIRLGFVPALATTVWIGAIIAPSETTLAYFSDTAKYSSPTNGVRTAPWFTCAQATNAASYGSQPYLHYGMNDAAGTQLLTPFFHDDAGNAHDGVYFAGALSNGATPALSSTRACLRDPGSTSVLLNGTSSLDAQFIREQPNSLTLNGAAGNRWNTFSINVWFRTNLSGAQDKAGALAAYSVSSNNLDAATDRVLYLDTNGYLRFEVYPGAYRFVTSPTNYADNLWHMATATLGAAGQCLYVDGILISCDASTTTAYQTASSAMYWRFGYATMSNGFLGITDGNQEQRAFHGYIDDATIWTRQLGAREIRDMYRAAVPIP